MRNGCPGCGKGSGGICPECEILARSEVTVSRGAWSTWLAVVAVLLLSGLTVWLSWASGTVLVWGRLVFLAAFPIAFLSVWVRSSLKRPIRLTIHRDVVEFDLLFGPDRWVPLRNIETRYGRILDRETGERIPVGEIWYTGAGRFHRALRAKLAMMVAEEEAVRTTGRR